MNDIMVPNQDDSGAGFDITAITKLKHADLWAAAKKLGSQAALARHLGIRQSEVGEWINLKRCPPSEPAGSRWTEDYLTEMEGKLLALTGKTWEELFPPELRMNAEFLDCGKTIEKTARVQANALRQYALATRERFDRISQGIEDERRHDDKNAAVQKMLRRLSRKERLVIEMRFGLGDGFTYTNKEIAQVFKCTAERIRQIEAKALQKLQCFRFTAKQKCDDVS